MAASAQQKARLGDAAFDRMEKINAELLTLTYGALVTQLLRDYQDPKIVNRELERMGYNIGTRVIDEFLARSGVETCRSFLEACDNVARVGFKMFLGVSAELGKVSEDEKQCSVLFRGNPLDQFVELPPSCSELHFSNILCGVIRGALFSVNLVVECQFVQSELKGSELSEIRVTLKEVLRDVFKDDE